MAYRGLQRSKQAARVRRLEAEQLERDLTFPADLFNDNDLASTIYRMQTRTQMRGGRLGGKTTLQNRLTELCEESAKRKAS